MLSQAVPDEPALRLETHGPTTLVTALAFGPGGRTLYEAGWDKVVRVWTREDGQPFTLDGPATYRVPIGPGLDGAINALAVSPDGNWLAVAGYGVIVEGAGFRQTGLVVPMQAISDSMRKDQGTIYVFNTRVEPRNARVLRGHLGPVFGLAFAPSRRGKPPLLLSAGRERERGSAVKLWDVEAGEELGSLSWPSFVATRPGLAVWHDGDGRTDIRAAVAWQDRRLRLWDVGARAAERGAEDGLGNNTSVFLPDRNLLLTASFEPETRRAILRGWIIREAEPPRPDDRRVLRFAAPAGLIEAPRALVAFPSKEGGPLDRAAVILRGAPLPQSGAQGGYSLVLVGLGPDRFETIGPRRALWPDDGIMPALAASPDGRTLAVAGNRAHEVRVYAVDDLLAGRDVPQRLRGAGSTSRSVAFLRKGDDWGLRLDDGLVFDIEARRLTNDQAGWTVSAPSLGPWRSSVQRAGRDRNGRPVPWSVVVQGGQGGRVSLEPSQSVTATALRPPSGPGRRPLVAIAHEENGEPGLGLYDGESGALVRRLTGHAERIVALAFSGDGRLLASTAEDRTVKVWSLTDLDANWNSLRMLRGVSALNRDGQLVVGGVDAGKAPGVDLREGDVLRNIVESDGRRLRPLGSFADLRDALSGLAPGQAVTLLRSRGQERPGYVAVRAEQGADERKPLFSLFLTGDDGAGGRSWIGWSPLGPYETSDRDVERLLGWHVNTGQPESPARFATADQYRDQFYREGLLRDLVEQGALLPPKPPPPFPRPGLSLLLDPSGQPDDRGMIELRRPPDSIGLMITDNRPPEDGIEAVRWQIDDAPARPLSRAEDGIWTADASDPPWGRGIHRVRATLRTREATPQEFHDERLVRLQPPPPEIDEGRLQDRPPVVEEPVYRFRALIRPLGGPADIRLIRRIGETERLEKRWERVSGPTSIDEQVTLGEGSNVLELIAVNADALRGFEEEETARRSWTITYSRKPVPPPRIELATLRPLEGSGEPIPADPSGPIVVSSPRVRLEGRIVGEEPLSSAERLDGEGAESRPLVGFVAGQGKSFEVSEALDLKPGVQSYRLRTRAGDSEAAEGRLTILYRPRLPEVRNLALDPSEAVLDGEPGGPTPAVRLTADLVPPSDPQPFRAVVLVHEQERPVPRPVRGTGRYAGGDDSPPAGRQSDPGPPGKRVGCVVHDRAGPRDLPSAPEGAERRASGGQAIGRRRTSAPWSRRGTTCRQPGRRWKSREQKELRRRSSTTSRSGGRGNPGLCRPTACRCSRGRTA